MGSSELGKRPLAAHHRGLKGVVMVSLGVERIATARRMEVSVQASRRSHWR